MNPRNGLREPGPLPLMLAILASRPNLPGAACTDEHDLFDAARWPVRGQARAVRIRAVAICGTCPVREACPDRLEPK